ncbi:TPA: hypothetical protein HA338_08880 [Methanosarcina acetivorans]|uniref:Zona occludens toxin N-terminal domain-containing protein n=1 Tax=Methanosarcina acetivorans TaxID=2214 RepID=A0A832VYU1_9EURY|nr:hypothetical protein [Methanosarcina acetivorans]HIH94142.1 hypothetical protein [Methanosarcina acetivorans]
MLQPGIYCVHGPPGSGKTSWAVEKVLPVLRSGKIPVFSNFLIIDPDTGHRSLQWKDEYKETLVDAWIIKDEAWSDIDSTDWMNFTKADNSFFRLSRQNGLVIIIISQTGVVKTVREISNMFVECHCWHLGKFPLLFRRRFRRKFEDRKHEFQNKSLFNRKVGAAYNHRAFRIKRPVNPMTFEPWEGSLPEYVPLKERAFRWVKKLVVDAFDYWTFNRFTFKPIDGFPYHFLEYYYISLAYSFSLYKLIRFLGVV